VQRGYRNYSAASPPIRHPISRQSRGRRWSTSAVPSWTFALTRQRNEIHRTRDTLHDMDVISEGRIQGILNALVPALLVRTTKQRAGSDWLATRLWWHKASHHRRPGEGRRLEQVRPKERSLPLQECIEDPRSKVTLVSVRHPFDDIKTLS
jgi:hypothetical protein